MSYASRFFQSVGATSVHASAARLTSIANAVNGRKALRHAFESARYGERKVVIGQKVNRFSNTPVRTVQGVSEEASYMPKRRNQHSKPYTVVAIYRDETVVYRRGDAKAEKMTLAKFIDTVKL